MPRGFINITNTGLTEIASYLDKLAEKFDPIIKESVDAMQDPVVQRIRENWVTMVGGKAGGYVYDSIGKSNAFSKTDAHTVVGTMGVYNLNSVNAAHGKIFKDTILPDGKVRPADFNAPQIAYWIEYGTSRLKNRIRKKPGRTYDDKDLIDIAAQPFLGNAFYGSIDEQNEQFKIRFNSLVDKIK